MLPSRWSLEHGDPQVEGPPVLLCWEAFVSTTAHRRRKRTRRKTARRRRGHGGPFLGERTSAKRAPAGLCKEPDSLIGAAALWSGCSPTWILLKTPTVVLRPTADRAGEELCASDPGSRLASSQIDRRSGVSEAYSPSRTDLISLHVRPRTGTHYKSRESRQALGPPILQRSFTYRPSRLGKILVAFWVAQLSESRLLSGRWPESFRARLTDLCPGVGSFLGLSLSSRSWTEAQRRCAFVEGGTFLGLELKCWERGLQARRIWIPES